MKTPATVVRYLAAALLTAALTTACNEEGSYPGSQVLSFKSFSVSETEASIGDVVTVSWQYSGAGELRRQHYKLLRLGPGGIDSEEHTLAKAARSFDFTFDGPVTVVVVGTDKARRDMDAATDVRLDSIYHFSANGVRTYSEFYPRLGQPRIDPVFTTARRPTPPRFYTGPFNIEFTHFFGIYEMPPEDGVIDALREVADVMPTDQSYFARSLDAREDATPPFRFAVGSAMPFLDPGFLLGEGSQFLGIVHADAVAFAGKIAYDGQAKRDKKTGQNFRTNIISFEPIFATVDLRSDDQTNFVVADMHLGNAAQGLVVSVYHGVALDRNVGSYSPPSYTINGAGAVGEVSGNIKGSRLAFPVTPAGTNDPVTSVVDGLELIGAYVDVADLDWRVQFLPDTNLTGVQ